MINAVIAWGKDLIMSAKQHEDLIIPCADFKKVQYILEILQNHNQQLEKYETIIKRYINTKSKDILDCDIKHYGLNVSRLGNQDE